MTMSEAMACEVCAYFAQVLAMKQETAPREQETVPRAREAGQDTIREQETVPLAAAVHLQVNLQRLVSRYARGQFTC